MVARPLRRRARRARRGAPVREPAGAAARRPALEPARRSSPRRSTGCARSTRRCAASASTRGASTTRCSTATAACSGCRSTTATRAPTGWSRARTRACAAEELLRGRPASRRCRSTRSSSCWPTSSAALVGRADRARARTCSRTGCRGELANEITNASTTGLLDARSGTWARGLIERLGLPAAPFAGDPVEAGHDARPGARPPRHRRGRAPGGQPRHRVGVRGGAGPQRARGDPVVGHLVAARARARRARC